MNKSYFKCITSLIYLTLSFIACSEDQAEDRSLVGGSSNDVTMTNLCEYDQDDRFDQARRLGADMSSKGFICPVGDQDWFIFQAQNSGILSMNASMDTAISPVNLSYELYAITDQEPSASIAVGVADLGEGQVNGSHCIESGRYALRVRDHADDAQDKRTQYTLSASISADKDEEEREDEGPDQPRVLEISEALAEVAEGYISCEGDEDWYAVDVDSNTILKIKMTLERSRLQPRLQVFNSSMDVILTLENLGSARSDTLLSRDFTIQNEGRYLIKISSASEYGADFDTPYILSLASVRDPDLNEPNQTPSEATQMMNPLRCDPQWSEWQSINGGLATLGDFDWFILQFEACERGVIEAQLTLDDTALSPEESYQLQQQLQLSMALIRSHEPSICERAEQCQSLQYPCNDQWDCAGISNVCLPSGVCGGTLTCMPDMRCAATIVERRYQLPSNATPLALPPHVVRLSAPIESVTQLFLRVNDFGGNSANPLIQYQLKVRTRSEPDLNEPSNRYTDELRRSDRVTDHLSIARERNVVVIHDCSEGVIAPLNDEVPEQKDAGLGRRSRRKDLPLSGGLNGGDMGGHMGGIEGGIEGGLNGGVSDENTAGMNGGDVAGEPVAGDTVAGEPVAGNPMAGEPVAGEPVAGDPVAGEPVGGEPVAGEPVAGEPVAGEPVAGEPVAGELVAGEPVAGEMLTPTNGVLPVCCTDPQAQWTEGFISYEEDQDFYAYPHPCPGEDCMVKIYYEIDEGPVDMLFQVYQGDRLWFDPIVPVTELQTSARLSGVFGGLAEGDQCFYAWQGHEEPYYYLSVRDLRPTHDWSTDQRYRFCIEKAGKGCFSPPCTLIDEPDGGCSVPRSR